MASTIDTSQLIVEDTSARGATTARIKTASGNRVVYTPDCYLNVAFEPSLFDKSKVADARRLNLFLEHIDRSVEEAIKNFELWIVEYLQQNSERLLKRSLTPAQAKLGFSSCLSVSDKGYSTTLKTKIDVAGTRKVVCWDAEGKEMSALPERWKNVMVRPRLLLSHLWAMGQQFGVVIQVTDVEVAAKAHTNPFQYRKTKESC